MTEQQTQHSFTEAPASWNIRYRVNGFDEQLTLRGESFASIKEQVDAAREYVRRHFAPSAKSTANAINTELPAPAAGDGKQVPVPAAQGAPGAPNPTPQQQEGIKTLLVTKLEVVPRADERMDIKLYGAGHQYPDMATTRTPEQAVALFAETGAWTTAHFAGAATYPVKMLVGWVDSEKLNKNGKPYKNIVGVKPA